MKIWTVKFNDARINTYQEVADTSKEAIAKVLEKHTYYKSGYSSYATEFKIDGYVIEVYDEKSYNRDKNIEKLGI